MSRFFYRLLLWFVAGAILGWLSFYFVDLLIEAIYSGLWRYIDLAGLVFAIMLVGYLICAIEHFLTGRIK